MPMRHGGLPNGNFCIPAGTTAPVPGVLHIHGGAMVMLSATGPAYARIRDEIAHTGLVVVGVEFRNAGGVLGAHPFPAGLEDCAAALRWVHEHRAELGVTTLTIAGESGGANLALAVALKAKRDGDLVLIDGVYAMVPYISGRYGAPAAERAGELPSLVENDGYLTTSAALDILAAVYDPADAHATDPLCWPYHAGTEDVRGLPPHIISVNELDPLRDEGVAYHETLVRAGVQATLRMVPAVCHGGDLMFRAAMPEMYLSTIRDIHRFATGR
jgi:acetyl esterase